MRPDGIKGPSLVLSDRSEDGITHKKQTEHDGSLMSQEQQRRGDMAKTTVMGREQSLGHSGYSRKILAFMMGTKTSLLITIFIIS